MLRLGAECGGVTAQTTTLGRVMARECVAAVKVETSTKVALATM
jgi:hypothetical protein